ncbi:glycoside hydrolase family 9 protein [Vibrio sp. SCSIO 43136]|uniref:glycoside hydrolase family 9 protein n=1 Tax=Vibrio sp. SCSIO 43136 TaxID=2819101 RepID=UPI002074CB91|nr:glycoside hydrolase family 9 protein [Vibrio sp. SCSIO 43136]USD64801.1 glycoside hydrolase family 9 protein [Vibrio sp. SCSIO 43136]
MQILTNHIGYEVDGSKQAVLLMGAQSSSLSNVEVVCAQSHTVQASISASPAMRVARWHHGYFCTVDFSHLDKCGHYYLKLEDIQSHVFEIGQGVAMQHCFSDLLHYFKSQRCSGVFDRQDQQAPIVGSSKVVDVHGGWYDASGDVSKYLSHLSYSNFFNPQQTPMVVWNMLKGLELLEERSDFAAFSQVRLIEEALFGADFLVRMQSPEGFFYMTVFDQWSKDTKQREICAYETQQGNKTDAYQAAFRQGGGIAIAALAKTASLSTHGDFSNAHYLECAERGYWHLIEHNSNYLDDGRENIIDEYCALLAAVELYRATSDMRYLEQSREWALRLGARQQSDSQIDNFWSATDNGERPYFHAAEAGLPVISLCEYLDIETDLLYQQRVQEIVENAVNFELDISAKVANPFGYPRQYVKPVDSAKHDAFFVAHNNETGYWWQGENARIASLASMVWLALPWLSKPAAQRGLNYAQHCLNWILGLNPYDMCMIDGKGHNNPDYLPQLGFFNAKGGVCNGITSGFDDEQDIAFNPPKQKDDMLQNWRWGEQWIPHGAWLLLAVASQFSHTTEEESAS